MPLAVPLHGEAVGALGHGRALVLLYPVAIGQLDLVDGVAHLHDGVYRAFFSARNISRHVNYRLQILAVHTGIDGGLLQIRHFLQRDLPTGRSREPEVFKILNAGTIGP